MLNEITEILHRSRATLVEDALGGLSLFLLLFAGLSFSGAF